MTFKERLFRSALRRVFMQPCPNVVSHSGHEGARMNCFVAYLIAYDGKPYLLLDSLNDHFVNCRRWDGKSFSITAEERVQNLLDKELSIIHYYGLEQIECRGVSSFLWHRYIGFPYIRAVERWPNLVDWIKRTALHMKRPSELSRQKDFLLFLGLIFIVCSFLMVKSSSDRNQIIFDSAAGINVSLIIYALVVWLPERNKRERVRRNLQLQYDAFKEECICIFLSALGGGYGLDEINRLKDRDEFLRYFKESFSPDQTRWDAVANRLDEQHVKLLAIEFEILRDELHFTLNAIDVDNPDAFAFLKRLSQMLHRTKQVSLGYDDKKTLLRFLWSVHTGWSWVDGYTKKDTIVQAIESI